MTSKTDLLAIASDNPHVSELLSEYNRAMINASQGNLVTKFDNIRFSRWAGQTDDGKKHSEYRPDGSPAWPFEGASDVRNRLIEVHNIRTKNIKKTDRRLETKQRFKRSNISIRANTTVT